MKFTAEFIRKHFWIFVAVLAIFYVERIGAIIGNIAGPVFSFTRHVIEMAMR